MRTLKVELTQENDDGEVIVKTLEGEEAEQWQDWLDQVCLLAWSHGQNPEWSSLHWEVRKAESDEVASESSYEWCAAEDHVLRRTDKDENE